jgi:Protein of unknown function (DUF1653)
MTEWDDIQSCTVTIDETLAELRRIEKLLAERYSLTTDSEIEIRGLLITMDRNSGLVEDRLVADWHCQLTSYRHWINEFHSAGLPEVDCTVNGTYRHYKGGTYTLKSIARLSEDRDTQVAVYVSHLTQDEWVRPLRMFRELVYWDDGKLRPRFEYVAPIYPKGSYRAR